MLLALALAATSAELVAEYKLLDKSVAPLDARLFGHFLERPSWGGEIGIEAGVVPGTSKLQASVEKRLRELAPPILRFPAGTDADYIAWTDMISNAPGREKPDRPVTIGHQNLPVTNHFGFDEFFSLAERLHAQTIVPVRFRDALLGLADPDAEARKAAALLAYAKGSPEMADAELAKYARARVKNGRKTPYRLDFVQIGNETWFFSGDLEKKFPDDPWGRYTLVLEKFADAIHAVDPNVRIIADGWFPGIAQRIRKDLGDKVALLSDHKYVPWGIGKILREGQPIDGRSVRQAEIWGAWVAAAPIDPNTHQTTFHINSLDSRDEHGYRFAITEWNWVGWWNPEAGGPPLDSLLARGVGAAGILHAMMRRSDAIELATMSMTVGQNWDMNAIRADPKGERDAYFTPTGQLMRLYANHHGDRILELERRTVPTYRQPLSMNDIHASDAVEMTDLVVSADAKAIYVHAINRSFDQPVRVKIDLSSAAKLSGEGRKITMVGKLDTHVREYAGREVARLQTRKLKHSPGELDVVLEPRTVSVLELRR